MQVKKHENVFGLVTPRRTYYIEARSHQDMQDWVAQLERARDAFRRDKAEEATVATLDTPDTPTNRGKTSTPTQQPQTQPISIIGPSSPRSGAALSSSAATSSTSPLSPDGRSSSYTSQASNASVTSPAVPPNSFVQGLAIGQTGAADLHSVDARLAGGRQREQSVNSSVSQRPASPGVASSSEDEDDDYFGPDSMQVMQVGSPPLQVASLDPTRVVMKGYLVKQGKRKNWRKRYFILISTRLMYARSHMVHRALLCPLIVVR